MRRVGASSARAFSSAEYLPVFKSAQFGEKFDAAIITSKGYAAEACRRFLKSLDPGRYRIFCLHDADPAGYNIARTLAEETARMPGYEVDVTDLGLTAGQAIALGLQTESFVRKGANPESLRLDPQERRWFDGTQIQLGAAPME